MAFCPPFPLHKSLTEETIVEAAKQQMFGAEDHGFCVKCGERHHGLEPDARKYPCEYCETPTVYGAEELLFMTVP